MNYEIAIVGAGLAGLSCARVLAAADVAGVRQVGLFEKARKPGGRMSTRRGSAGTVDLTFDHGAQYFTVRDPRFRAEVLRWAEAGVAQPWAGSIQVAAAGRLQPTAAVERWTGVPTMSAIPRALAAGLDVHAGLRIAEVRPLAGDRDRWALIDDGGREQARCSAVVIATPAAQAAPLLAGAPSLAARASAVVQGPCWAVMLGFAEPLEVAADGLFIPDSPLGWAARDSSKPGRGAMETWVLHATPDWTATHWDDPAAEVIAALHEALIAATGARPGQLVHTDSHRWRYARSDAPLPEPCLFDGDARIAACGDWCGGARVEGAWASGQAVAERILAAWT